jgi:predicted ATP-dependent protease
MASTELAALAEKKREVTIRFADLANILQTARLQATNDDEVYLAETVVLWRNR